MSRPHELKGDVYMQTRLSAAVAEETMWVGD
jgi:hypothetical protein